MTGRLARRIASVLCVMLAAYVIVLFVLGMTPGELWSWK